MSDLHVTRSHSRVFLVPKLRLGTPDPETPFRPPREQNLPRQLKVVATACGCETEFRGPEFPNGVWEREKPKRTLSVIAIPLNVPPSHSRVCETPPAPPACDRPRRSNRGAPQP